MTAAIEDENDLAGMFGDWNTARYTPEGFPHPSTKSRTINGIFNSEYLEDSGAISSTPNFRCESTEVEDVSNGAKLRIENEHGDDIDYVVRDYQSNGSGAIYLILEKII